MSHPGAAGAAGAAGADPPTTPTLRPMGVRDVAAVQALAARVPTAPHWPPAEYDRMLQTIAAAPTRRAALVLTGEPTRDASSAASASLIGFAFGLHTAGLAELEAVVVSPEHRNQGYGAKLVQSFAQWAVAAGALKLALELRVSNAPALALYRRLGFTLDGTRRGYYRNPEEDALLMSLVLQSAP